MFDTVMVRANLQFTTLHHPRPNNLPARYFLMAKPCSTQGMSAIRCSNLFRSHDRVSTHFSDHMRWSGSRNNWYFRPPLDGTRLSFERRRYFLQKVLEARSRLRTARSVKSTVICIEGEHEILTNKSPGDECLGFLWVQFFDY